MKFNTSLLALTFGLTALSSAAVHADSLAAIHKAGVVRIGVPQDFAPFGSIDGDMHLQGLDIDVARLIADKMGVRVQLVPVASANRIAYLQTHKTDLIISTLGKNSDREKVIDFSQPYAPYNNSVFGVASIKVSNAADLAGKTIGVARGTFQDLQLTLSAPTSANIKRYEDNNALISAYTSGQIQLVGTGDFVAHALAQRVGDNKPVLKYIIQESACAVGLNKGEPALLNKVNEILTAAKKSGELNGIVQKWLSVPLPEKMANTYH